MCCCPPVALLQPDVICLLRTLQLLQAPLLQSVCASCLPPLLFFALVGLFQTVLLLDDHHHSVLVQLTAAICLQTGGETLTWMKAVGLGLLTNRVLLEQLLQCASLPAAGSVHRGSAQPRQ